MGGDMQNLTMKLVLLFALFVSLPGVAQTPPLPVMLNGSTITFTANVSGSIPTPVQAPGGDAYTQQYIITNSGQNLAFVKAATTSAAATSGCIVPPARVYPVLPTSQIVVTDVPNAFFCAITSSGTSVIYVTPSLGQ